MPNGSPASSRPCQNCGPIRSILKCRSASRPNSLASTRFIQLQRWKPDCPPVFHRYFHLVLALPNCITCLFARICDFFPTDIEFDQPVVPKGSFWDDQTPQCSGRTLTVRRP